MVKSTIGAVLACLYVALSVWLVRSEGQSYRNSLNQARPTAAVTDNPVREHTAVTVELPKADVAPPRAPEQQRAEGRDKVATAPAPAPTPAAPAAETTGAKPGVPLAAESKQVATQPPQVAMLKPASAITPDARLAKLDQFWSQPEVKKNWELSNLSDQDEMRLGEDLHNMIMRFNPPASGGPWRERVHAAAKPLLARVSRRDVRYTFTILDSEAVNAFSHPGGYVYLSRGLFGFIGEDENVILQFILAHEIAHVDLHHMIQCLQDPGVQKIKMGTLEKVYFFILPLGYLDKQEFAADQWAYRQLIGLDHTRYEALKFLRKLKGYAEAHEFNDGRAKYEPRPGSSPVENHLRAHTAAWMRLDDLESFIDQVLTKPK